MGMKGVRNLNMIKVEKIVIRSGVEEGQFLGVVIINLQGGFQHL
jgi:hypothetical protein